MKMHKNPCSGLQGLFSYRGGVCVMMFTACWISYMLKVNMSLNILDMVVLKPSGNNTGKARPEPACPRPTTTISMVDNSTTYATKVEDSSDDRFYWSSEVQGVILGSYFWGYALTSLPGGVLAERFGPRLVVAVSTLLSGVLTALCPVASRAHYGVLLACRFLLGALGGVVFPALHCLISRWSPPTEKGKFVAALMGGTFGTVITWTLCGALLKSSGWPAAFYVPGAVAIAWSVLWYIVVSDSPSQNRFISEKEKAYILESIDSKVQAPKALPPFRSIFTSIPFLAMVVLHFGNMWGIYFQMTAGPSFIAKVLGFNLQAAGILAGLPYLSRVIFAFIFGIIGDAIRARTTISLTLIRKVFVLFSHMLPGALLVGLAYVGCDPILSLALITSSLGLNGAATLTNLQSHQDLAPNFAGTLYGIANCIGSIAGFITPSVTAHLTKTGDGFAEWRNVFFVGAAAYFISAIFFIVFGTAQRQSWNEPKEPTHSPTSAEGIENKALEIEKF